MIDSVVVVGCGNIGLSIAVAFAAVGVPVLGMDVDERRLSRLTSLSETIHDPGLSDALARTQAAGTLRFSSVLTREDHRRCFLLAVATPWVHTGGNSGYLDRTALESAFASVIAVAAPGDVVCVRSTVPVGTTRELARSRCARMAGVEVVSTPDRSIEGNSFREQSKVPHLIGAASASTAQRVAQLFARLGPVVVCANAEEAEAAKLLCNVTRDVMFGLANELARLCEALHIDFYAVREAAGAGYGRFALPRPGPVGGPCLSKDVYLLLASDGAPRSSMLEAARRANADLPGTVAADILQHLSSTPRRPVVCLFGVAFKGRPAVKDVRGSVALEIARMLEREADDLEIRLWDPEIPAAALQVFGYNDSTDDPYRTAAGASVIVLANDHPALEELDLERLTGGAPETLIYDLCGVTRQTAREFGGFVRVLGCGDPANSLDRAMVTA